LLLRRGAAGRQRVEFAQLRFEFFYSSPEPSLFRELRLEGFEISVVGGSANKAEERGPWAGDGIGRENNYVPSGKRSVAGAIGGLAEHVGGLAWAARRKLSIALAA